MAGITLVLHILLVLYTLCSPGSGSHSLLAAATYIRGDTPFPKFSAVLMLDDLQVGYCSTEHQCLTRGPVKQEDIRYDFYVFKYMHDGINAKVHEYFSNHNNTDGIFTHQSFFGCDLLDSSKPGRMIYREFFNKHAGDEVYLNISDQTLQTVWRSPVSCNPIEEKQKIAGIFQPICINTLHELLKVSRNHVMRKVKPRVRLFQKTLPDFGGAKVTCLATGFYPRHINLTLLRDGQSVSDHQTSGGELLPNGDGTYQMRKSLEVSAEQRREKHQYTCKAEHLSLDNKLDIPLDYELGPGRKYDVAVTVTALACFTVALVFCWKRCVGKKKKQEEKEEREEEEISSCED